MAETIYVGQGKEMNGKYGVFHKISFSADDLKTLQSNLNEKGYVNLNMNKRKAESQYGDTHCLTIDTWVKDKTKEVDTNECPF